MTGKLLSGVADTKLRWDRNFTSPWWLTFPGYNDLQAPSTTSACGRPPAWRSTDSSWRARNQVLVIPWGNWISAESRDAGCAGMGRTCRWPEYDPRAKQLWRKAGFPNGFDFEGTCPLCPT